VSDRLTSRLLGSGAADDPGCEECLAHLHAWAEAVAGGIPGEAAEPRVAAHLRDCPDCAEDAEGLLVLVAKGEEQA
jgi:hypothetical protein